MRLEDIRIGDVLRIRDWDDMALEFGEKEGNQGKIILTYPAYFITPMKYLCGRTFTVSDISPDGFLNSFEGHELKTCFDNPELRDYIIAASMLQSVSDDIEEDADPVDLSGFLG